MPDRPKKVTTKWVMATFGIGKQDATEVRNLFNEWLTEQMLKDSEKDEDVDPILADLTAQEKTFCLEYLKSHNSRTAALNAGYPAMKGGHLLMKDHIRKALRAYQDRMEKELFVSSIDILKAYIGIAFADITDYVTFGTETIPMLDGYGHEIRDKDGNLKTYQRSYVRLKDSKNLDGRFIQEVKSGKDGISIKMYDKLPALDKLAKVFDLYNESEIKELQKQLTMAKAEVEKAKAKAITEPNSTEGKALIRLAFASERSDKSSK